MILSSAQAGLFNSLALFAAKPRTSYSFVVHAQVGIQAIYFGLAQLNHHLGIAYCSAEHQKADWADSHKAECRVSKALDTEKLPAYIRSDPSNPRSPIATVTIPLPYHQTMIGSKESFVNYRNPMVRVKPESKSSAKSQCAKTIYGPGARFLVRARWGGHAGVSAEQRRAGGSWITDDKDSGHMLEIVMGYVS